LCGGLLQPIITYLTIKCIKSHQDVRDTAKKRHIVAREKMTVYKKSESKLRQYCICRTENNAEIISTGHAA